MPSSTGIPRPSESPRTSPKSFFSEKRKEMSKIKQKDQLIHNLLGEGRGSTVMVSLTDVKSIVKPEELLVEVTVVVSIEAVVVIDSMLVMPIDDELNSVVSPEELVVPMQKIEMKNKPTKERFINLSIMILFHTNNSV